MHKKNWFLSQNSQALDDFHKTQIILWDDSESIHAPEKKNVSLFWRVVKRPDSRQTWKNKTAEYYSKNKTLQIASHSLFYCLFLSLVSLMLSQKHMITLHDPLRSLFIATKEILNAISFIVISCLRKQTVAF